MDENATIFDDLAQQIGFVTQDTQLFAARSRQNLVVA